MVEHYTQNTKEEYFRGCFMEENSIESLTSRSFAITAALMQVCSILFQEYEIVRRPDIPFNVFYLPYI